MSDKCLMYWSVFAFLHLLTLFISFHPDYNRDFDHITFSLSIVHGPFIYLYTNILTKVITAFKPILLLHFAPTIICFLLILAIEDYYILYFIDRVVAIISLTVYAVLSLRRMKQYQKDIADLYSNIELINYDWLKYLITGIIIILLISLASSIIYLFGITPPFTLMFCIFMLIFCSLLVYKNIIVRTIYIQDYQATTKHTSDASYQSSKLTNEDLQEIAQSIEQYMKEKKPYLNMDLKLSDIAKVLNAYPHYITEALNTIFKRNFNDYVNSYRVQEAKIQLLDMDKKNITIVGVAYDCGFNSRSSFYRIFKQNTGYTPTEYIKLQRD